MKKIYLNLLLGCLLCFGGNVIGQTTDLLFSEYVEGSSNNKYLEIYNGTGASVNLSNYEIRLFSNGSLTATNTLPLTGTLADGAVIVYKNSSATIYPGTATANATVMAYNGDDAIALWKVSTSSYVDIIGQIGCDPGTQWISGTYSTVDKTLRRKSTVCSGITTNPSGTCGLLSFTTLTIEWDLFIVDDVSGLGAHTASCASCTSPTTQASILTANTQTTDGFSLGWTAGNGNGTLIAIRPTAQAISLPVSGTAYTPNLAWGAAAQIDINNRVVFRASGTAAGPVTGLNAETQYTATGYEYNNTAECYNLASPPSVSIYTLSLEPSAHGSPLSCSAPAYNQIDLSFPSIAGAGITNADGYIILQKTGSAPTGLPVDGNAYTAGATIGDATVAAIVSSTSATTQSVTGLSGSVNYYFTLIPYNSNAAFTAATYNYRTAATIPVTNCTTPTAPSLESIVVDNTNYATGTPEFNSNINYINFIDGSSTTTGKMIPMKIKILDGGLDLTDADALPTILSGIKFTVQDDGAANRLAFIKTAILTTTGGTVIATASKVGSELVFSAMSGANVTAPDGGTAEQILHLRVSFDETQVIDNTKLIFAVSSVTAGSGSSGFAAANGGGAQTDASSANDRNRIEVTADRIVYGVQPASTSVNTTLAGFTLRFTDLYGRLDFDNNRSVTLVASNGGVSMNSSASYTLTAIHSGVITVSDVVFTTGPQTGITITATTTGLGTNSVISSVFNITTIIYPNNAFRSTGGGTWTSTSGAGTATWEQYSTGTGLWSAVPGVSPTGSANVFVAHAIIIPTAGGSMASPSISIMNGASLTWGSSSPWTAGNMYLYSGSVLQINTLFTVAAVGIFEVEDNATVNFNYGSYSGTNLGSSLWQGTEKFHPNSNFVIQAQTSGSSNYFIPTEASVSANLYNGFTACFGNLIFDSDGSATYDFFGNSFTTKNLTHNDFIVRSSAATTNALRLTGFSLTTTIGRDFIMESGSNRPVTFTNTGGVAINFTVNGNLVNNSIKTLNINNGTAGNIFNLKGDLTVSSSGLLTATLSTIFNLNGTGDGSTSALTQTIDISSTGLTETQNIGFNINSGAFVQIINQDLQLGNNSSATVSGGGILDFGFTVSVANIITEVPAGAASTAFTLASGGKLKITHPNGIDATSTAALDGNVQTDTRTYSSTGIYHYIGKAPQQRVGDALAGGSSGKSVIVELDALTTTLLLEANSGSSSTTFNTINVGLSSSGNGLKIIQGTVVGVETGDFFGSGGLEMTGGIYKTSVSTATSNVPQLSGTFSLTAGVVELNGSGVNQILNGAKNYYNVKFSGSNVLGTNDKRISSATTVANSITIAETAIVNVLSFGLGSTGTTFTMSDNSRYITDGGSSKPDATGTYALGTNTTIEFANASAAGVIRLGSPAIQYANVIVSGTNVANTSAGTGILFQSGGTFTVKDNAIFKISNTAGFTGSTATAISNTNGPTITLEPLSTIEYAASANQIITNGAIASPTTGNYAHLSIAASGVKTAPSGTLTVQGNLTKSGTSTFAHNDGLVLLNGTTQSFAGLDFYGLEMSAGTKTTNGSSSIADVLNINSNAVLNITDAETVSLKSTSTKTARIGELLHTTLANAITYNTSGKFVVERHIVSGRKWRYLSIPTDDATQTFKSAWQEGATVRGDLPGGDPKPGYGFNIGDVTTPNGSNGFDIATLNGPSIKTYTSVGNTYTGIPIGTGTNTIINSLEPTRGNHLGYMAFVPGDRSVVAFNQSGSTTLRSSGKLNVGAQNVIVPAGEFRGIGNPYASPIDMVALLNPSFPVDNPANNIVDAYYAYDPKINQLGAFQTLDWDGTGFIAVPGGGSYTAPYHNSVESGQGFFVKGNTGLPATLNFTETIKTPTATQVNFTSGVPENIRVTLNAVDPTNAVSIRDGVLARFDNIFSDGVDQNDVRKMTNINEEVCLKNDGTRLAVEKRGIIQDTDTLYLEMLRMRVQNYQWEIISSNLDFPGRTGFLIDRYLNTSTPLNMAGTTTVNFNIDNIAGSYAVDRFKIVFNQQALGPVPVTITTVTATRKEDRSIYVNWKVENETNISSYEVERSADGSNFGSINSRAALLNNGGRATYLHNDLLALPVDNFYRIKASSIGGQVQYSAIVKVSALKQKNSISVYPNPVVDGNLQLRFSGQAFGNYQVQLSNAAGQVLYKSNVAVSSAVQSQMIPLPANITSGSYQLRVVGADGGVSVVMVTVK